MYVLQMTHCLRTQSCHLCKHVEALCFYRSGVKTTFHTQGWTKTVCYTFSVNTILVSVQFITISTQFRVTIATNYLEMRNCINALHRPRKRASLLFQCILFSEDSRLFIFWYVYVDFIYYIKERVAIIYWCALYAKDGVNFRPRPIIPLYVPLVRYMGDGI
jgi:hypothetical protein